MKEHEILMLKLAILRTRVVCRNDQNAKYWCDLSESYINFMESKDRRIADVIRWAEREKSEKAETVKAAAMNKDR